MKHAENFPQRPHVFQPSVHSCPNTPCFRCRLPGHRAKDCNGRRYPKDMCWRCLRTDRCRCIVHALASSSCDAGLTLRCSHSPWECHRAQVLSLAASTNAIACPNCGKSGVQHMHTSTTLGRHAPSQVIAPTTAAMLHSTSSCCGQAPTSAGALCIIRRCSVFLFASRHDSRASGVCFCSLTPRASVVPIDPWKSSGDKKSKKGLHPRLWRTCT